METAKIFWSGRSQAVRLPKAYRFDTSQVRIRRQGSAIVLEPLQDNWDWLQDVVAPVDEDFTAVLEEQAPEQERPGLDLFR